MTWRVIEHATSSGHVADLCRSFGWIVLFNASWTLGECVGYLRGAHAPNARRRHVSPVAR
jgi:hypothetical protein